MKMLDPHMVNASNYPDIRDPRVMVAVPHGRRAAMAALWGLAERLTKLLHDAREPLIAQIKLAWWRDMLHLLASDPAALPKGEPLLADLQACWTGDGGLDELVDAAETMLLAVSGEEQHRAARDFGARLFALSDGDAAVGQRWGLLWGTFLASTPEQADDLMRAARSYPVPARQDFARQFALFMLDRWAGAIAARAGERRWRSEGLLLLRLGIFGR